MFYCSVDPLVKNLRSLVRKWKTLIEAHVDVVKTLNNFTLRMLCIGFTKRRQKRIKRTCYAQSCQIRKVELCLLISTFSYIFHVIHLCK
ncbi:hypothetical protein MKW92_009974 [Papaver armeniacum]|nr:hypothetical protein MKW92_009974 [Papaver armeniacum]